MKKLTFSKEYEIDGKKYDRVTSICQHIDTNAGLIQWAAKVGFEAYENGFSSGYEAMEEVRESTANIGSSAHHVIETHLKSLMGGEPPDIERLAEQIRTIYVPYFDWASLHQIKPLLVEETVYSERYGVAGTLDAYIELDGVKTLVDLKTGSDVYSAHLLQLPAYKLCMEEKVEQYLILNINREGKLKEYYFKPNNRLDIIFLSTLKNYRDAKELNEIKKEIKKQARRKK